MAVAFLAHLDRPQRALFTEADYARQRAFFAAHPELEPTPLRQLHALARSFGIGELLAKDETARFGLTAFKAAGATFAIDALWARGALAPGDTLVCASEGNHGRAVAHAARLADCRARVYMASSVAAARVRAIEGEGATVILVDGSYDIALRVMAAEAAAHGWRIISDTALDGEDVEVPRLIMLGYTRLMDEVAQQTSRPPDVIFVPGGVGGLLAAVAEWATTSAERPRVVGVEPVSAACLQASARAGYATPVPGPFDTVMGGLRCGEVSRAAFEVVRRSVDALLAIEDRWALDAMRLLAGGVGGDPVIHAGASGAAALGGLLAALGDPGVAGLKEHLGLGPASRVLVVVSEGVTDPELFAAVVPRPTSGHSAADSGEP